MNHTITDNAKDISGMYGFVNLSTISGTKPDNTDIEIKIIFIFISDLKNDTPSLRLIFSLLTVVQLRQQEILNLMGLFYSLVLVQK